MASFNAVSDPKIAKKLENFFGKYKSLVVSKGDLLLSAHDQLSNIYYVKKGAVRFYTISDEGEEVTYHIARPGSYFPMMLALAQKPNRYYHEAIIKTEVILAPFKDVEKFIKTNKDVLLDLTVRFASGLCGMMIRIENLVFDSAYVKTVSLLSYFGKRYGQKNGKRVLLEIQFTHANIASWLGINRETVSRQMKKLENNGFISYQEGLIVINDLDRLHQESLIDGHLR